MKAVDPGHAKAGKGSIVNFSSIWGNVGVRGAAAYNAGKGGVRNLTKNAAVTYAPENIRVNSVHPGLIRTPLVIAQSDEMNAGIIGTRRWAAWARRAKSPIAACSWRATSRPSSPVGTGRRWRLSRPVMPGGIR